MNKRRILVTTFEGGNYGTYLQGYALCKVLDNEDGKCSLLTSYPQYSFKHTLIVIFKKLCLLDFYLKYIKRYKIPIQTQRIRKFKKNYLNLIELYCPHQLHHIASSYDIFITGSDQIWNTYHHFEPNYFLAFVKNKKKIAYSSSIGTATINPVYVDKVKKYLSDFSEIAVREETGARLLTELLGREIHTVVDPVFLLSKDEWEHFASESEIEPPQDYFLCYCIAANSKYIPQTQKVSQATNLPNIVYIPSMEHPDFWKTCYTENIMDGMGPLEFIKLFLNASYICTDSFHAAALAIIFNKPFTILRRFNDLDKNSQNSRIYDLLSRYSLSNRLYDETTDSFTTRSIDYDAVNKMVSNDIKLSRQYLSTAINS